MTLNTSLAPAAAAAATATIPPTPPTNTLSPPNPTPIITLPQHHLHIRAFQPRDAPSIAHHANNTNITRNMTNAFPDPYTLASAESWITFCTQTEAGRMPQFAGSSEKWEGRVCPHWAIVWTGRRRPERGERGSEREGVEEEEVVGSIGLKCQNVSDVHGQSAEVGYWLGEEFWGRGWMTGVLRAFVEWVWRSFPVHDSSSSLAESVSMANGSRSAETKDTAAAAQHKATTTKWRAKGIDRLEAAVFAWNVCGSGTVLERCGFQKVGVLRGKVVKVVDGVERRCDVVMWDLLREGES